MNVLSDALPYFIIDLQDIFGYYIVNQLVNSHLAVKILYYNNKVEKYFTDFSLLQKKLPIQWVRTIKKHLNRLEAAETFGDFLALDLGNPERLSGGKPVKYSLHVSANVRLIVEPLPDHGSVLLALEVKIIGVNDYHGNK